MAGTQPALSDVQIAALAEVNFHDLGHTMVVVMTAVALAESNGIPDNQSPGFASGGEGAGGLWQIQNNHSEAELGVPGFWSQGLWKDPVQNAIAARTIYNGQGISAWSAYTNGAYAQYLLRANTAVDSVEKAFTPSFDWSSINPLNALAGFGIVGNLAGAKLGTANVITGNPSTGQSGLANGALSAGGIFAGMAPTLWIAGGALLVVLAIVMLAKNETNPITLAGKVLP